MRGSYEFDIQNKKLHFNFIIRRNITVIRGDSGTGKTTLLNALYQYLLYGKRSGFKVKTDCKFYVLLHRSINYSWKEELGKCHNMIIFLEENNDFVKGHDFANFVSTSDNYFVFVTRNMLKMLPYSYKEIYTIECDDSKTKELKVVYTFKELYSNYPWVQTSEKGLLITEDSGSGYQFYSKLFSNLKASSSFGNSNVIKRLECSRDRNVLCVVDGAAFGAYIGEFIDYSINHLEKRITLWAPESFEWVLLRAGVITFKGSEVILAHPEDFIESSEFVSWERFFIHLAEKESDEHYKYKKEALAPFYLQDRNLEKVTRVLPQELRGFTSTNSINRMNFFGGKDNA